MRLIHCTQKLLKELAVVPTDTDATQMNSEGLGNWYANILRFDRRKCILFTNERTLYSFLVPGVLKKDLIRFNSLFINHLAFNLQYEGFSTVVIERVLEEYKEINLARTLSIYMCP